MVRTRPSGRNASMLAHRSLKSPDREPLQSSRNPTATCPGRCWALHHWLTNAKMSAQATVDTRTYQNLRTDAPRLMLKTSQLQLHLWVFDRQSTKGGTPFSAETDRWRSRNFAEISASQIARTENRPKLQRKTRREIRPLHNLRWRRTPGEAEISLKFPLPKS